VFNTKMSCGRILPPIPPSGFVYVSTLPWVLIRIIIVNREAAGPLGERPKGWAQLPWACAGVGAAERPPISSRASRAAPIASAIRRRTRADALPCVCETAPAIGTTGA
jgi:hypothetical protein